ncbi:MAG: hypothetical protein IIZ80_06650 [Erysipelotrichaceae bacterium]|nr:hypothetical protein [Erysipelotrichaceae bacterium]
MKKLILLLLFLVSVCLPSRISANVDVRIEVDRNVEGKTNTQLSNQFVNLELDDPDFSFNVEEDEDITSWFTNIPEGFTAVAEEVDNEFIKVSFTGQTSEAKDEVILVTVPSGKISYMGSVIEGQLSNDPDSEDSRYIITEQEIRAYYNQPSTISGYVGEQLEIQYVYIKLENDTFKETIIDSILSTYNGLTATVIDYDTDNIAKVEYTGIPLQEDDSLIHSILKNEHLNISENDLTVPDREDVRFDIRKRSITPDQLDQDDPEPTYTIPYTGIE